MKNTCLLCVHIVLLAFLSAAPSPAQEDFWVQTSGPKDEFILSLAVDSCGGVLVATNTGLFTSTDQGASWVRNTQLAGEPLVGSIVLPGGEILISGRSKLFRSTDCGGTWEKDSGAHIPLVEYVEFARAPDGTLYGCTGDRFGTPGVGRGVYRSLDDGKSWSLTCIDIFFALSVAVNSQGHVFAGADSWQYSVYRTQNYGESCEIVLKPGTTRFNKTKTIAVTAQGVIFAGTNSYGLYGSLDNGESWFHNNGAGGLPGFTPIYRLFVDADDRLYAGTGGKGVFRSSDNGHNWEVLPGIPMPNDIVQTFALDSLGYLYAGVQPNGGVYRSRYPIMTVDVGAGDSEGEPTLQVRPQPLRQNGTLEFSLPRAMTVTLALYDVLGRPVRVLQGGGLLPGGRHTLALERAGLPAGLYFLRMATPAGIVSRQLVISR